MSERKLNEQVLAKARNIKLLLMDCDGVLTDGRLYYSASGEELKVFHVRDGQGLVNWHQAGYWSGIITGRKSKMLEGRAKELGVHYLAQASKDKRKDFESIVKKANLTLAEVAYIGDDTMDLALFGTVGLSIAVADAEESVIQRAEHVTKRPGGLGAVREVVDLLLSQKP